MGGGSDAKKQLGKILLQQKLVSAEVLQEMLDEQKREPGARLASTAARSGRIAVGDALMALSVQHDVPPVDLADVVIPLAILRLIPVEMARERALLPIRVDGEQLLIAMSSPDQRDALDEIAFVAGKQVVIHVALDYAVRHVIDHAYEQLARGEEHYVGAHVSDDMLGALGLPSSLPRAPEPLADKASPSAPPEPTSEADELGPPPPSSPPSAADGGIEVMLDAAFSARGTPSNAPEPEPVEADARVLVAHRDPQLRGLLTALLAEHGVSCLQSDDGVTALELMRSEHPRLCVIDPALPSVHGLDICRRLRASTRYASLPIVLVTESEPSWRFLHDVRSSFGVAYVTSKPYDGPALVRSIRLLLHGQSLPEEPPPLSPEAEARWSTGMAAFERGDLTLAIRELEAGLALEPRGFELLYHLGLLYGRRDDLFAAMRVLEQAARVQSRNFAVIKNLAVVYQRAAMLQSALDAWQRAATCAPDDATRETIKAHVLGLL